MRAGWTHVRLYGGAEGYMRSLQLGAYYDKPTLGEEELRHAVVSLAKQYLGTQYRWGGKSPLGIDCSGLVGSCYLMYGVDMYRNADIKEGFCVHEIERKDMKKGDMLFFKGHVYWRWQIYPFHQPRRQRRRGYKQPLPLRSRLP